MDQEHNPVYSDCVSNCNIKQLWIESKVPPPPPFNQPTLQYRLSFLSHQKNHKADLGAWTFTGSPTVCL